MLYLIPWDELILPTWLFSDVIFTQLWKLFLPYTLHIPLLLVWSMKLSSSKLDISRIMYTNTRSYFQIGNCMPFISSHSPFLQSGELAFTLWRLKTYPKGSESWMTWILNHRALQPICPVPPSPPPT